MPTLPPFVEGYETVPDMTTSDMRDDGFTAPSFRVAYGCTRKTSRKKAGHVEA